MKYHYYSHERARKNDPGLRSEPKLAGPVVDDQQVLSWFVDSFSDFQTDGVVIDAEGRCHSGLGERELSQCDDSALTRCCG